MQQSLHKACTKYRGGAKRYCNIGGGGGDDDGEVLDEDDDDDDDDDDEIDDDDDVVDDDDEDDDDDDDDEDEDDDDYGDDDDDDDGDGDGEVHDGDDDDDYLMRWMSRTRRKMMMLRRLMLRRKTYPNPGKHTLCEPAQSKCTWTGHKSHLEVRRKKARGQLRGQRFVRACAIQMHTDISQEPFAWKFTGKCQTPRRPPRFNTGP